jgi:Leucine-rich repeat (LRR) protein
LVRIPNYVFDYGDLEAVVAAYNKLTGPLPANISRLKKLRVLNLSYNNITELPAEISELANLEVLNVSHNHLTSLPSDLSGLKNLRVLDVSGNPIVDSDLTNVRAQLPKTTMIVTGE